jgi:hypothetical protein
LRRAVTVAAVIAALAATLYYAYHAGLLEKLPLPWHQERGGASAFIVVDTTQSFARVTSVVPFTVEMYIKVRVLGEGSAPLCYMRLPDLGVTLTLHVDAQAGSEGWLTTEGIAEQPTPITVELLASPQLGDTLEVIIGYCDGRVYEALIPIAR